MDKANSCCYSAGHNDTTGAKHPPYPPPRQALRCQQIVVWCGVQKREPGQRPVDVPMWSQESRGQGWGMTGLGGEAEDAAWKMAHMAAASSASTEQVNRELRQHPWTPKRR